MYSFFSSLNRSLNSASTATTLVVIAKILGIQNAFKAVTIFSFSAYLLHFNDSSDEPLHVAMLTGVLWGANSLLTNGHDD